MKNYKLTTTPAAPPPKRRVRDMEMGEIGYVQTGLSHRSLIMRTWFGLLDLEDPKATWDWPAGRNSSFLTDNRPYAAYFVEPPPKSVTLEVQ